MKNIASLLFAMAFYLAACSNSEPVSAKYGSSSYLESLGLSDFTVIHSKDDSVTLGTDDSSASIKDRPSMVARFDYDFLIGKHEVTCAEMNLDCEDSLPATDVTFFDAVLYANRLSVAGGFDTAYSYTSAVFDKSGSCVELEGFAFHAEKNAYRLPTEAEWVYAAAKDWNPQNSWNNANSDYRLHPVCSLNPSADGICDMAGNAMEWVGDLLVPFKSGSIDDFVGGKSVGGIEERVLKGGSYRVESSSMKLYNRGDVYTVTSSAKAPYIGFRLAFGAILNPQYMDLQGNVGDDSYAVLVEKDALNGFLDTASVKLVFRNALTGKLVYVDYTLNSSVTKEMDVGVSAYHPDISPDGRYVAFCTGQEGVSEKSQVYVRRLDAEGLKPVKLDVESAAIPRWRVLENGDTVIVYVTNAGSNKDDSDFKGYSTWQVPFANGRFGTPVKLFDGNYHGGISRDNSLSVTGSKILRAHVNGKDEVWYDGEQACNVSLNRGNGKQTLFLDFSAKTGRAFVGEKYAVHGRVFFMDSVGTLIRSLKAPEGYTYDHTEWVAGSDSLFVATLTNAEGAHRKIILQNAYTGESLDLVMGEELWHPALWKGARVVVDPSLNLDSAGVYYTDGLPYYALELSLKMENFWDNRKSMTAVVLGSSRVLFGINAAYVPSQKLVNMAFSSGDIYGMWYLAMNYVLRHSPNLEFLVLEFSPDFLWVTADYSWAPVYAGSPGFNYDESHQFWVESVPSGFEYLVEKSYKPFDDFVLVYDPGEFLMPVGEWGSPEVVHDSTKKSLEDPELQFNMTLFETIVNEAERRGVTVVLIVPPQNPKYAETGSYGIYGVRRSVAKELLERASQMNVVLFDENKMGAHDYKSNMAYNTDHLSYEGTKRLSARLDSLLRVIKK